MEILFWNKNELHFFYNSWVCWGGGGAGNQSSLKFFPLCIKMMWQFSIFFLVITFTRCGNGTNTRKKNHLGKGNLEKQKKIWKRKKKNQKIEWNRMMGKKLIYDDHTHTHQMRNKIMKKKRHSWWQDVYNIIFVFLFRYAIHSPRSKSVFFSLPFLM